MRSILSTISATLIASTLTEADAVKLTINQQEGLAVDQQSFMQVDSHISSHEMTENHVDQMSAAQWGFLKNIVNIDTFFASGSTSSKKSMSQTSKKEDKDDMEAVQIVKKKKVYKKATKAEAKKKKVQEDEEQEEEAEEVKDEEEQDQVQIKQQKKNKKKGVKKAKKEAVKAEDSLDVQNDEDLDKSAKLMETQMKEKQEKEQHAATVRNEGIEALKQSEEEINGQEIDLEIEAPGAANKVAEEGAKTIQNDQEYQTLLQQLKTARALPGNKIGQGGQLIDLKSPKEYTDTMRIVVLHDQNTDEKLIKSEKFETKNPTQAKTAAMAMQMTLETQLGAAIIDDGQPGRESIISNVGTDVSKTASQIVSGYSIRNSLVQKMAPGDKMYYIVSYEGNVNKMNSFKTRKLADDSFVKMKDDLPRILISGETGDILEGKGSQNWRDQCLGMFLTQRYQGKYYGQS